MIRVNSEAGISLGSWTPKFLRSRIRWLEFRFGYDIKCTGWYLQVCHIVLGLKPVSRQEEGRIVQGWLQREDRRGYSVGQFWCLIAIDWWHAWEHYVTAPVKVRFNYFKVPNEYYVNCLTNSLVFIMFPECFGVRHAKLQQNADGNWLLAFHDISSCQSIRVKFEPL